MTNAIVESHLGRRPAKSRCPWNYVRPRRADVAARGTHPVADHLHAETDLRADRGANASGGVRGGLPEVIQTLDEFGACEVPPGFCVTPSKHVHPTSPVVLHRSRGAPNILPVQDTS